MQSGALNYSGKERPKDAASGDAEKFHGDRGPSILHPCFNINVYDDPVMNY